MKRRLKGSYTVEAAFVMALVLWAVLFSVQAAYRLRDETVGAWHCMEPQSICAMGRRRQQKRLRIMQNVVAGRHFHGAAINQNRTDGKGTEGPSNPCIGNCGNWSLEISQDEYDPEIFCECAVFQTGRNEMEIT